METLDPFGASFWLSIGTSVLCGTMIGLERQFRGKPAGIRTSILICLATQVFVQLSAAVSDDHENSARVIGQVVTGVGFLGGGVILARGGLVTGVTSAAVIWVLAAVGATIGLGNFRAAIAFTLVVLVVLCGVDLLERSVRALRRGVHAIPAVDSTDPMDPTR